MGGLQGNQGDFESANYHADAKGDEEDELTGFELGVDEYISKPFSPKILVARVGAILRRSGKAPEEGKLLSIGGIVIDQTAHTVTVEADRSN